MDDPRAPVGGELAGGAPWHGLPARYHVRARSAWRRSATRVARIDQNTTHPLYERYALVWLEKPRGGWKFAVVEQHTGLKRPRDEAEQKPLLVVQNDDDLMEHVTIKPTDPYVATYLRETAAFADLYDLKLEWITRRVQPVYRARKDTPAGERLAGELPGKLWSSLDAVYHTNYSKSEYVVVGDGGARITWHNDIAGARQSPDGVATAWRRVLQEPPAAPRKRAPVRQRLPPVPVDLDALASVVGTPVGAVEVGASIIDASARSSTQLAIVVRKLGSPDTLSSIGIEGGAAAAALDVGVPNIHVAVADGETIVVGATSKAFVRAERISVPGVDADAIWQTRVLEMPSKSRRMLVLVAGTHYLAVGDRTCHIITYSAATRQLTGVETRARSAGGGAAAAALNDGFFVYGTGGSLKLYSARNLAGTQILAGKAVLAVDSFNGGFVYVLADTLEIGVARLAAAAAAAAGGAATVKGEIVGTLRSGAKPRLSYAAETAAGRPGPAGVAGDNLVTAVHVAMMDGDRVAITYGSAGKSVYVKHAGVPPPLPPPPPVLVYAPPFTHVVLWSIGARAPVAVYRDDGASRVSIAPVWMPDTRTLVLCSDSAPPLLRLEMPARAEQAAPQRIGGGGSDDDDDDALPADDDVATIPIDDDDDDAVGAEAPCVTCGRATDLVDAALRIAVCGQECQRAHYARA